MFRNYFRRTFRYLKKNKTYSFLNIAGLAVGIACAALIFLWVEDELTFDDYFPDKENLYIVKDQQTYDGTTFTFDATPGPMAPAIRAEIPGIKNTSRCTWGNSVLFSTSDKGDKELYDDGNYVDPAFLSMFGLKFIKGDPANAFHDLYSLVITETMAKKFFNSTDVLGKTLTVNHDKQYTVTGVIEDLPRNVSLYFHWLAPFEVFEKENLWLKDWGSNALITYVQTNPGTDIAAINKKLHGFVAGKAEGTSAVMSLYPMKRWWLYNTFDTSGNEQEGRLKYVHLFSLIAWIILVIACINFMNLSTARSEQHAREVGVRKVMGASRHALIVRFLSDALFMAGIAALISILFIYLVLPSFNLLVGKHLSVNLFMPTHVGSLALITLLCGLIAGSYPSFYLSSFRPVSVLKGYKKMGAGGTAFVRKGLVVLQFSVSVVLIISAIIIYQQLTFVRNRDLGYDQHGLIFTGLSPHMKTRFELIKNDLVRSGLVKNAALSNSGVLQMGSSTGDFQWEGKDPHKQVLVTLEGVSAEYISTMGMQLKKGRDFYPTPSDSNNIIINEAMAKLMNNAELLGSFITRDDGKQKYRVVGVMKDFIYNSMYAPASPLILFHDTSNVSILNVRLNKTADTKTTLAAIEKIVRADNPGYPVEFNFLDDAFNGLFRSEGLLGKLAGVFAGLAIFISCLGLFGLSVYMAERRTKEIGIRKVLGATVAGITALLSRDFIKLVLISSFVAFPVAAWMMYRWLQEYQYHVKMNVWIFVVAGVSALLIALITISFQTIKASMLNPVKNLRGE